jgi:hypothetical protein
MKPLRFYTPGKAGSGEPTARSVVTLLTSRGWQRALDWTDIKVQKPYLDHMGANRPAAEAMKAAAAASDLVVLVPDEDVFGALIETGVAIAFGAQVAVLGASRQSIFWCLPGVHLVEDLDGMNSLVDEIEAQRSPAPPRRSPGRRGHRGNLQVYRGPEAAEASR